MIAATPDAQRLMHEGILTFSKMEQQGIRIDVPYVERAIKKTTFKINRLEQELKNDKVFTLWKKRFGEKTKLRSKQQLEKIVFDELGFKRTGRLTDAKQNKADESAFEFVKHPFVTTYFEREKLLKSRDTYLYGILNETIDGWMHPFFDLHGPVSYRSSSSRPNFQNWPIRNEEMGKLIRRAVIAPKGYILAEVDISGNEVCWSVVYHKDPMMIKYITDPTTDMHRDMAMECFFLPRADDKYWKRKEGYGHTVRYCAKNRFVFPEFYGSFFVDCSRSLWEACDLFELKTPDGFPLKKWLKKNGIRSLGDIKGLKGESVKGRIETKKGTFVEHIRLVEEAFWKERFGVYNQWKRDWYKKYCEQGWFKYKTGFVGHGVLNRKQVTNYPIQGSAFHALLWTLIELQKWLEKHKMKSRIAFEIHDSVGLYLHKKEVEDVLKKVHELMTKGVPKHWPFINVPLSVEAEVCPEGGSWFDKKVYQIAS